MTEAELRALEARCVELNGGNISIPADDFRALIAEVRRLRESHTSGHSQPCPKCGEYAPWQDGLS